MIAYFRRWFQVCLVVLLLSALESNAQAMDNEVQRIQGLISKKEWTSAVSALNVLKSGCQSKSCLGKVNFAYAYLYHQKFNAIEGSQSQWRDSARRFYQAVLRDFPDNPSAYQNLSLLLKDSEEAGQSIHLLRQAYALNRDNSYLLSIGDQFLRQQAYDSAYQYYRMAADNDPLLRLAHDRLIQVYSLTQMGANQIMAHCRQMASLGFDELASKALVQVIQRDYARTPEDCERAFLWWTNIVGRNLSIDTIALQALPSDWSFKGLEELKNVLRSDWTLNDLNWWRRDQPMNVLKGLDLKPNLVMCEVIRSKAQQLQKQNRINACLEEYEKAYKVVQGGRYIHDFLANAEQVPDVFFQLAGELAMLYTKYPALDPGGTKFKQLESELFDGKGVAFMSLDKEAIMKFHTTLGLIYAEKNQWQENGYKNATFQLRNAIDKAPESKNTAYLKVLLANGQLRSGKGDQARRLFIEAAVNYLNDDDFASVETVLSRYSFLGGPRDAKFTSIKQLAKFRKDLEKLPKQRILNTNEMLQTVGEMLSASEESSYFKTIQRFKILSDLGGIASQYEDKRATFSYYGNAFQQVFDVSTLTNFSDVERINKQRAALLRAISFTHTPGEAVIVQTVSAESQLKKWELYADNFKKQTVVMSPDLLLGARVAAEFSALTAELTKPPGIKIDKRKITFESNQSPASIQLQTVLKNKGLLLE